MNAWLFPLMLVVGSNILYNVSSKAVPPRCSPYAVLVITYLTATVLSLAGYFLFDWHKGLSLSMRGINWTAFALGLSMVGLEVGYILMYRAGAQISAASLVANLLLAVALVAIGIIFYRENLNARQIAGIITCLSGCLLLMGAK